MQEETRPLNLIIQEKFEKLQKVLSKDGSSRIPPKLYFFINGKPFYNLIEGFTSYLSDLILAENRQQMLEKEAKGRGLPPPKILPGEVQRIEAKSRELAYRYSLFLYADLNQKDPYVKVSRDEQKFYELLITLLSMIVKEFFLREDHQRIEEEINRLFRSNAFNVKKRRRFEEQKIDEFPQLKEPNLKEPLDVLVPKLLARNHVPKKNWKFLYQSEKSEFKPGFQNLTTSKALRTNTPMISMLCPSAQYKREEFDKKLKLRSESGVRERKDSLNRSFVPSMLEREIKKRGVHIDTEDLPIKRINRSFF